MCMYEYVYMCRYECVHMRVVCRHECVDICR